VTNAHAPKKVKPNVPAKRNASVISALKRNAVAKKSKLGFFVALSLDSLG
jgi:hypothetical protein